MKHFTIPIFVPELACPNRCVFCNQNSISGCHDQPSEKEVIQIIEQRLLTIPKEDAYIEIGFFGGNFTGIDEWQQREYVSIAHSYLIGKRVDAIRLSTRPDYISQQSLDLLKSYNVTTIELGAQSLDEGVLKLAGRGHTVQDIENASRLILKNGFRLGLQMMTGLPGDTPEKSVLTAQKIIQLGASDTRIYPTLVIKDTELEKLWLKGSYQPQSLDEAVNVAANLMDIFTQAGVNVIRVGLHPSEDLLDGKDLLAGPFHPSFRQLVDTERWRRKLVHLTDSFSCEGIKDLSDEIEIPVRAEDINAAIGFGASNREMLLRHYKKVSFKTIQESPISRPLIIADKRIPLPAKNKLRNMGDIEFLDEDYMVYKSISSHPDIFLCAGERTIVVSPSVSVKICNKLTSRGYRVIKGSKQPEGQYPETARYNAVITNNFLIHNLKITDPVILENFTDRKLIHVNQGYTRCNLLPLTESHFITSDRGIQKTLLNHGLDILWVDPEPIVLKGQKHGFFPGCCGKVGNSIIISGSLNYHPQAEEIRNFIFSSGFKITELFDGKLTDVGSILVFPETAIS